MARGKKKMAKKAKLPRSIQTGLDAAAAAYAELLVNPCSGPLVNGPFGDGTGGFMVRVETDQIFNYGTTETASALVFCPSLGTSFVSSVALTSDTTAITWAASPAATPGYTFMLANAAEFRCLSACLQVYWPGSELNRAGIASVGQQTAYVIEGSPSTSALRSLNQYSERTPDDYLEIKWRPNNYDLQYSPAATIGVTPTNLQDIGKRSALVASVGGIPVSTGIRYRIVAVYEWIPSGSGLVAPNKTNAKSRNTFEQVINYLDRTGDWMYHGAMSASKAGYSLMRGMQAAGRLAYGARKVVPLLMG